MRSPAAVGPEGGRGGPKFMRGSIIARAAIRSCDVSAARPRPIRVYPGNAQGPATQDFRALRLKRRKAVRRVAPGGAMKIKSILAHEPPRVRGRNVNSKGNLPAKV